MHDFTKPNILMRFCFKEHQEMFIYSDTNGLEHMLQVLEDHPLFTNLLSPKEIFTKLSSEISYHRFCNQYNGLEMDFCEWVGQCVKIAPEEEKEFFQSFDKWIKQLENFVGRDNLFKVSMPEQEAHSYMVSDTTTHYQQNIYFMKCLETYRLTSKLDNALVNKSLGKNKKI